MASLLVGALPMALSSSLSFSRTQSASATSLPPPSSASSTLPTIYCGRGDRKTAKGKRFSHSFGNARPHDKKKGRGPPRVPVPPAPPRKDKYDDGEVIKIEIDESLD
ncbi:hypothetical protein Leryth_007434 [Lithospermum erythrorhizon]|nr:hypothetical protein Leryth_007434 [Lithospermum erythrorhizon]